MNSQLLVDALARDENFRVAEAEPNEAAILAAVGNESPDVVLLSSTLEDDPTRGSHVARRLRTAYPEIHIIMLLDASEPDAVVEAFRAGLAACSVARSRSIIWPSVFSLLMLARYGPIATNWGSCWKLLPRTCQCAGERAATYRSSPGVSRTWSVALLTDCPTGRLLGS